MRLILVDIGRSGRVRTGSCFDWRILPTPNFEPLDRDSETAACFPPLILTLIPDRRCLFSPPHKTFQSVKLGQAEQIVHLGGAAVAVFGPLPEFAAIAAARKHRPVLL